MLYRILKQIGNSVSCVHIIMHGLDFHILAAFAISSLIIQFAAGKVFLIVQIHNVAVIRRDNIWDLPYVYI